MHVEDIKPDHIIQGILIAIIAPALIPAILEISAAKRVAVSDLLSTGFSVEGGWELKMIFVLMAGLVMLSIPSWGILKEVIEAILK
ncbi:hypothetical protein [Natrialba asiatica]|uniref:Uncharacterized protein n=1 Tax=Natrialba asiatica (strain ATCC 700177 / DSM 12278 / JCM 9576 / FERM P-10747 / NBRC 102637 / 172P1) TaxID=29540 RepID=M0ATQ7_NATA1|nr:hypothetical protein [Natrialba asiatica]ELZ00759.1 hypothetical protein C481_11010 [Natrialba asiatica DSM 12278]